MYLFCYQQCVTTEVHSEVRSSSRNLEPKNQRFCDKFWGWENGSSNRALAGRHSFRERLQVFLQVTFPGDVERTSVVESRKQGRTNFEHGVVPKTGTGAVFQHQREKWRLCAKTTGPASWSSAEPRTLPKQAEERPKTHAERFNKTW